MDIRILELIEGAKRAEGLTVTDATSGTVITYTAAAGGNDYVVVIGENEIASGSVTVKDMGGEPPFSATLTDAAKQIAAAAAE